jgi:hypothetical protein
VLLPVCWVQIFPSAPSIFVFPLRNKPVCTVNYCTRWKR